jgi:hypothetical protein
MATLDYNRSTSTEPRSSRRMLMILGFGALAVAVAILIRPYTGAGLQQRNMAAAEQHLPAIQSVLSNNAQYANVTAEVWTGSGGGIAMRGTVKSANDVAQLKRDVQATSPPSSVTWFVRLDFPATVPAD